MDKQQPVPRTASAPEHDVEVHWDVRIPARDGLELSANLWLPASAPGGARRGDRVPASSSR